MAAASPRSASARRAASRPPPGAGAPVDVIDRASGNDFSSGCDDGAVPTLNDLARSHTSLADADVEHLHSLVSDWQLLADLSFADLILWAPLRDGSGWMALAQMRPTTGPTSFQDDVVGQLAEPEEKPLLDTARDERRIWRESDPDWT